MEPAIQSKPCTKCKRVLPFDRFHKHAGVKSGLRPKCKDCIHEQRTAFYAETRERSKTYSRSFYAQNRNAVLKYQKAYAKQNRQSIRDRQRAWRAANRERLLKAKQRDYITNKDRYAVINSLYAKLHPEYGRVGHHRRRARKAGASGDFTAKQLLEKFTFHGWRCYLCRKSLTIKELEIDHRIALSNGGSNWIANYIAPACHSCNQAKGNRCEKDYRLGSGPPIVP